MVEINGERLLADLRRLAEFGKLGTGVDRVAFSAPDVEARRWLRGRMEEGGLAARIDRFGNVLGRSDAASRAVVIGSHTDSVPKGGWLDGALGVIYGLEIARSLIEAGLPGGGGVDVVSFQDEEGTYLSCLGSKSFCSLLGEAELDAARGPDQEPIAAAATRHGLDGAPARLEPGRHLAYFEGHIEQGPKLEAARLRIGVVTGIVGIRRYRITVAGQADHAGTTPMVLRKDAGAAAVAIAHRVYSEFPTLASPDSVWNIGVLNLTPGAANVVPAGAAMVVEFRDLSAAVLDRLDSHLRSIVAAVAASAPVTIESALIGRVDPVDMDPALGDIIARAASGRAVESLRMPSGAGHDAMVLGRVIPSAMLFIPSIGGRSHDIVENTSTEDIILGCQVLADAVAARLAA